MERAQVAKEQYRAQLVISDYRVALDDDELALNVGKKHFKPYRLLQSDLSM